MISRREQILSVLMIAATACLSRISTDMYLPALPAISTSLQASYDVVQLSVAASFLGATIMSPICGISADYFGKKPLLLISLMTFVIGNLICAIAGNVGLLIAGRFCLGLGTGAMTTLAHASIQDNFSLGDSTKIRGIISILMYSMVGIAPIIGTSIVVTVGWRYIFLTISVMGMGFLIYLIFKFSSKPLAKENGSKLDFSYVTRNYNQIITNGQYMRLSLLYPMMMGVTCCYFAIIPYYYINVLKIDVEHFGFYQAAISMVSALGGVISYFFAKSSNLKKITILGIKITLLGGIIIVLCYIVAPFNVKMISAGLAIFGVGSAVLYAPSITLALQIFPNQRSFASGMRNLLRVALASVGCIMGSIFSDDTILPFALYMVGTSLISLKMMGVFNRKI